MIAAPRIAWVCAAVMLAACGAMDGKATADEPAVSEVSASPQQRLACTGATAIPPAVDALLTQLASPVRDHCERHRIASGAPALFVRTMNTVAHDDEGAPIPTCQWEVFDTEPARHLGTLSVCRFRVDAGCVVSLDDEAAAAAPRACLALAPPTR